MASAFPGRGQPTGTPRRFGVSIYNITPLRGGVDQVVEEIDRYSPDVAILEEIASRERLESSLASRYATVFGSGQFLVATRFPIVSSHDPEKVDLHGHSPTPPFLHLVIETPLGQTPFYPVPP